MAFLEWLPGESLFSLRRTSDLNQPQDVWDNVLWTGEIKMVFSHNAMFGKNQTLHINTNTLSQQLSTVVGA